MTASPLTLGAIVNALSLLPICEPDASCRTLEVSHVYAGDLLSRAMSRVTEGDLWITIMNNRNVIAVAGLADARAVVLAEGVELMPDAMEAARQNGIAVYSSKQSTYEICRAIARLSV